MVPPENIYFSLVNGQGLSSLSIGREFNIFDITHHIIIA